MTETQSYPVSTNKIILFDKKCNLQVLDATDDTLNTRYFKFVRATTDGYVLYWTGHFPPTLEWLSDLFIKETEYGKLVMMLEMDPQEIRGYFMIAKGNITPGLNTIKIDGSMTLDDLNQAVEKRKHKLSADQIKEMNKVLGSKGKAESKWCTIL